MDTQPVVTCDGPSGFYQRHRLLSLMLGVKLALRHNPPGGALDLLLYNGLWRWAQVLCAPELLPSLNLRGQLSAGSREDTAAQLALLHLPLGCLQPLLTDHGTLSSEPPIPLYLGLQPELLMCEAVGVWAEHSHRRLGGEVSLVQLAGDARRRVGRIVHPVWLVPALAAAADAMGGPFVSVLALPEGVQNDVLALGSDLARFAPPWALQALWLLGQERTSIRRGLDRLAAALGAAPCPWTTTLCGALIGLGMPLEPLLEEAQLRTAEIALLETVMNLPGRRRRPRADVQAFLETLLS